MKKKELFLISLTLFISVIIWIIADIYHNFYRRKLAIPTLPEVRNYNLDEKILDKLFQKTP